MTAALLKLFWLSLRGRTRHWGRQLRNPKYLIGLIVALAYLCFVLISSAGGAPWRTMITNNLFEGLDESLALAAQSALALVLALVVTFGWLFPFSRFGLPLKESELHLLLPAPLTRRQIIQYSLLKGQPGVLFTAILFSLFLGSGRPLETLHLGFSVWLFLTIWELHNKWASLYLLRARDLPRVGSFLAHLVPLAAVALFWAVVTPVLIALVRETPDPARWFAEGGDGVRPVLAHFGSVLHEGGAGWALGPFHWATGPIFARTFADFLVALLPALLLVVLFHEATVRSKARFEEIALRHAEKVTAKRSPTRRYTKLRSPARQRVVFTLPSIGRPEMALIWKNMLQLFRIPYLWLIAGALTAWILAALIPMIFDLSLISAGTVAILATIGLLVAPWVGALRFRNDLRSDLLHVDQLRCWPLNGRQIVTAEVISNTIPGLMVGLFCGGLLLACYAAARLVLGRGGTGEFPAPELFVMAEELGPGAGTVLLLALAGAAPLLIATAVLVASLQNLAVLLFPAWIGVGPTVTRGLAAFGQQMLLAIASGFALLIGALPGVLIVALAALAQHFAGLPWNAWFFPLWGLLGAVPISIEAALLIRAAARCWDDLDPSRELLEGSS